MKSFGIPSTQTIVSLQLDEDGNPITDSLRPIDAGNDWTAPALIPLIKTPIPDAPFGQRAKPVLVWTETEVTRNWRLVDLTDAELAAAYKVRFPWVELWQIKIWLVDWLEANKPEVTIDDIPSLFATLTGTDADKTKALLRWNTNNIKVPRNHPLTIFLVAAIGMTPEQGDAVWPDILAIS